MSDELAISVQNSLSSRLFGDSCLLLAATNLSIVWACSQMSHFIASGTLLQQFPLPYKYSSNILRRHLEEFNIHCFMSSSTFLAYERALRFNKIILQHKPKDPAVRERTAGSFRLTLHIKKIEMIKSKSNVFRHNWTRE